MNQKNNDKFLIISFSDSEFYECKTFDSTKKSIYLKIFMENFLKNM